ncbi:hypothetical protein Ct61P_01142 [Colletotrichum tofieldiae]|nr:hypothetical protein Ct61P_01142 [Colletotrichum tofieldiae]
MRFSQGTSISSRFSLRAVSEQPEASQQAAGMIGLTMEHWNIGTFTGKAPLGMVRSRKAP